ncbi:MAG: hypothetical protein FWH29_06160 [Methanobrevibacter sp.]|nr:hypothetical protein [Methanobrevibacter sp.]
MEYICVLFDLIYNVPIAETLYDDLEADTIKDFIESTIILKLNFHGKFLIVFSFYLFLSYVFIKYLFKL